jgi:thiamine pyrophosphokinase
MADTVFQSEGPVVLVGGGDFSRETLDQALKFGGPLVAADSGADKALEAGHRPSAVFGDLDSLSEEARAELKADLHHVPEQETTDFEKCLTRISAPLVLAVGFFGDRTDHGLAVMNTIARVRKPATVVIGGKDIVFHAPSSFRLDLQSGTRVSLFPMGAVRGRSTGLKWPITDIDFAPDGMIGTSNQALGGEMRLEFDGPGMLVILPMPLLDMVVRGLTG